MKPKSSQLPIAFYLAALMGLVFFDVTAGGCGIVGRHKTLDSDLLRDDAMQIFAEFGSANKRLPTTTEYVETYNMLLKQGKIENPLPNGWIVSYKPLAKSAYPWAVSMQIEIHAASESAQFDVDVDKRW